MRTVKKDLGVAVLFLVAMLFPQWSNGAYVLDTGFGDGGVTLTGFDYFDDRAHDIALQKDGKILVAGVSDNGADTDFAVVRYNKDGSLDTSFSNDGKATIQLGSGNDGAYALAVAEDGTIVVAGYAVENEKSSIALLRLTSTGFLDLDFGLGGQVMLELDDGGGEARDVLIDGEQRILITGNLQTGEKERAMVARFLDDGSVDTGFGDNGIYRLEAGDGSQGAVLALQDDGKIVVGGAGEVDGMKTAALFRLQEDGSIDNSFGDGGTTLLTAEIGESLFRGMVVVDDGSIVATGSLTVDDQESAVTVKFSSSGGVNQDFGSGGISLGSLDQGSSAYSITEKEDGSLIIVGEGTNGGNFDIILLHLDSRGTPMTNTTLITADEVWKAQSSASTVNITPLVVRQENSPKDPGDYQLLAALGSGKPLLTDINREDDSGRAVIVQTDGKVFAAGFSFNGKDEDFTLLSYIDDIGADAAATVDITTQPYLLATFSVTKVNRNGAMSGGVISKNPSYDCGTLADEVCRPAITSRGVVYGVTLYPVYRLAEDDPVEPVATEDGDTTSAVFPDWATANPYNYKLVRSGQTSDGSGTGTYGSDITKVTPDMVYYLRAYAVLADETVLYGNQLSFKTDDACFIATAAFGSVLEGHVRVLRQFRDSYLLTNRAGREFVKVYYHFSPVLADIISHSTVLRLAVRLALMPVVVFCYFMLHTAAQVKLIGLVLLGLTYIFVNRMPSRRHN